MAHLYAIYRCNLCGEIPETSPLYHCPQRHRYCMQCFGTMQKSYTGEVVGDCCCVVCKYSGKFERWDVSNSFLQKLRVRPGIGRPYRYNPRHILHFEEKFSNHTDNATQDNLFISKNHGDCLSTASSVKIAENSSSMAISRRPLICLHDECRKSVAVSSLVSHYKHEHRNIPRFCIERGKELQFVFNISMVEHIHTFCMAMITVYEVNKIDVRKSQSSQSIINTCTKLSGKVPINTFWLMVSGNLDQRKSSSYVFFWLYTNTSDKYWCTVELSSLNGKNGVSTVCRTVGLHEGCELADVTSSLNCLFVTRGMFLTLLNDAEEVKLNVTLH